MSLLDTQIESPSTSRIATDLVRGLAMIEAAMSRQPPMLDNVHPTIAAALAPHLTGPPKLSAALTEIPMPRDLARLAGCRNLGPSDWLALGAAEREFGLVPVVADEYDDLADMIGGSLTGQIYGNRGDTAVAGTYEASLDQDIVLLDITATKWDFAPGHAVDVTAVLHALSYPNRVKLRSEEVACRAVAKKVMKFYGRDFAEFEVEVKDG